jgi:hypothetical protein
VEQLEVEIRWFEDRERPRRWDEDVDGREVDQVSRISTSPAGSTIIRSGGILPSSTMQWAISHCA